jgi:hypothetical protein
MSTPTPTIDKKRVFRGVVLFIPLLVVIIIHAAFYVVLQFVGLFNNTIIWTETVLLCYLTHGTFKSPPDEEEKEDEDLDYSDS